MLPVSQHFVVKLSPFRIVAGYRLMPAEELRRGEGVRLLDLRNRPALSLAFTDEVRMALQRRAHALDADLRG